MPSDLTAPGPVAPSLNALASYYVCIEGQTQGPYTNAQVAELASKGTITPETPLCAVGADRWATAAAAPGITFPPRTPPPQQGSVGTLVQIPAQDGFQHATAVLHFKEKSWALSRKELLQGLDEESAKYLTDLGMAGWELVSAVPFTSGGVSLTFNVSKTDAVLAFFKRRVPR